MTWAVIPFFLQGFFILIDEFYFHQRRELPKWERIGHPLDTLSLIVCIGLATFTPFSATILGWYMGLSLFSCLLVTKDEWIHIRECSGGENWVHSILFMLHPLVLFAAGIMWVNHEHQWLLIQFFALSIYAIYQTLYWNVWKKKQAVNNDYYNDLGERWYKAQDDPIALLRSESRLFVEWIDTELRKNFIPSMSKILDIGCGGGLLSNELARRGWKITAVDLSQESLAVAKKHDATQSVNYQRMDAEKLSFEDGEYDAVISLDMLEHVESPARVVAETSRILKKEGLFFFHTFNRTFLSWLFAIKGLEWLIRNTPKHLHVYHLFITPDEFKKYCHDCGLSIAEMKGVGPRFSLKTWIPLIFRGRIIDSFEFQFTRHKKIGYAGIAKKNVA